MKNKSNKSFQFMDSETAKEAKEIILENTKMKVIQSGDMLKFRNLKMKAKAMRILHKEGMTGLKNQW